MKLDLRLQLGTVFYFILRLLMNIYTPEKPFPLTKQRRKQQENWGKRTKGKMTPKRCRDEHAQSELVVSPSQLERRRASSSLAAWSISSASCRSARDMARFSWYDHRL
jgi:hypothetical protein